MASTGVHNPSRTKFLRHVAKAQTDLTAYLQQNPERMNAIAHSRGICPMNGILYDQCRVQFEPKMCADLVQRFGITDDEYDTDVVTTVF